MSEANETNRREWAARALGVAVGLFAAAVAWSTLRWPAPAIAFALGFGAYLAASPKEH